MPTPKFRAKVDESGQLTLHDPVAYAGHLRGLKDSYVVVSVRKATRQRSLSQNAYYWGVVLAVLATETGGTAEEVHGGLRRKYLSRPSDHGDFELVGSTTDLSTAEFEIYLARVRADAGSGDLIGTPVSIPLPHEVELDELAVVA